MPQLFKPRSNAFAKIVVIAIIGLPIALIAIAEAVMWSPYQTEVGIAVEQPVPFSHEHHVGEINIDCRFCHSFVENSHVAGMPSSKTCMTCHSQIWRDAPMLKPVRDSFVTKVPIAWNQVNRLPKFVYFDHSIHINKGVGCTTCHGDIAQMPLTEKARTFFMRDCLSCHREPENYLRPSDQIFNPAYQVPRDQASLGKKLVEQYNIHQAHLTDCNTCHR